MNRKVFLPCLWKLEKVQQQKRRDGEIGKPWSRWNGSTEYEIEKNEPN